jgi:hypothetical protein
MFDLGIERVSPVFRFKRPFWRLYLRGQGNRQFFVKRES